MQKNFLSGLVAALIGLFVAGAAQPAHAHPHVWIDLRSQLVFDGDGRMQGLEIDWTFDELYSAFVLEDVGGVDDLDPDRLKDLGRQNLSNLAEFDYFTEVLVDGTPQAFAVPEVFDIGFREGKLWMRFTLPLAEAVAPDDRRISYAVFDPTYFVSILHLDDDQATLPDNAPDGCATAIEEPNPSTEAISFAQSLDLMDSAPDTLGALFAERVRLTCN